jgi:hypothetical protein
LKNRLGISQRAWPHALVTNTSGQDE